MKHTYLVVPLSFAVFCLSGCSGGFLSTPYENTVAYFNTYYNAKRAYNEAVEEIGRARPKTFQPNMFASPTVPQTARTKLLAVIEKCSKIIQFYPRSSLVDDALFLIGSSYSMLGEILPARKKFLELMENFPNSDHRLQARLSMARTEYAGQNEADALRAAREVVEEATAAEEWDIAAEALLLEGQIRQEQGEYAQAIEAYTKALGADAEDELLARAAFERAKCHEATGETTTASVEYHRVLDFDPVFVLEYQTRLKEAMSLAATGKQDEALGLLKDLEEEQLTPEDRSRVLLETGNTHRLKGDYTRAFEYYDLVDSLYKRTDAAAQSYYQRGLIHEYNLVDFQLARQYYDKARTEFPQSEIARPAGRKYEILGRYVAHRTEFAKQDSLLRAVLSPPPTPPDSGHSASDSVLHHRVDTLKSSAFPQRKDSVARAGPAVPPDSLWEKRAASQYALGVLFFVDLDNRDSASYWLNSLLRDRPQSRYAPQSLYVLAELERAAGEPMDSLHAILLSRYPDSEYARSVKGQENKTADPDSVDLLYAAAMRALDSGDADHALRQLKRIVRRSDTGQPRVRARYTIGWIYENIAVNKDSAIAYYRGVVADQPGSVFAQRVRPKLAILDGKELPRNQPAPDSVRTPPGVPDEKKKQEPFPKGPREETKPSGEEKQDDPK